MIREITITPVLNGFVCKVGCQQVVFTSAVDLALAIEAYYKNPEAVEKEFLAKAVNKMRDVPCVSETTDGRITAGEEACDAVRETRNLTPVRESVGNARSR